jgi:hypothetical protein
VKHRAIKLGVLAVIAGMLPTTPAFATIHEGGWQYPAPPPAPPSLEAHPATPETQDAYLSSVKVIYDDETGAVTLRFAFFDPAFWSPAQMEYGVPAGWRVGPTVNLTSECTAGAEPELTLYTDEADPPHLGTGIALATLTGYTGASSAPVAFTGEGYEATVVNPAFRNRTWRCLNISPSEHPAGGGREGELSAVDDASEVELSGYPPTPEPAPVSPKSTAVASRLPTRRETQALIRAAHRSTLLVKEHGRLNNRALPWGKPGCCTILHLRISTVNPAWGAGMACYLVPPDGRCDGEALLFQQIKRTWTLVGVGEPLNCKGIPRGVARDLKYGCLLPQARSIE